MKSLIRLAAVALLAASPALAKDFISEPKADLFGFYMPMKPVRAGSFALHNLSLGDAKAFAEFEAGRNTIKTYAPAMLEFDDVTSTKKQNELGQDYYARTFRVLPTGYRVQGNVVTFSGHDKTLGDVFFAGTLDRATLKKQKALGPNGGFKAVLKGDLSFAGQMFKNVTLGYFAGE